MFFLVCGAVLFCFVLISVLVYFRFLKKTFGGTQKVAGAIADHPKNDQTYNDSRFRILHPLLRRDRYHNVDSRLTCLHKFCLYNLS